MPIIETEKIKIRWSGMNKRYYVNKGYKFTKMKDTLMVDYHDLPIKSMYKVKCKCDYCGKEFYGIYKLVHTNKQICCNKKSCMVKKSSQTKRGKADQIKEKIKRRKVNSCKMYDYIKKKENAMNKELLERRAKGQIPSSKYQKHYCELLDGTLNFVIGKYIVDILLANFIYVECDFYKDFLYGNVDHSIIEQIQSDMETKDKYLQEKGYKGIHLINYDDEYPSDKKIKEIIESSIEKLNAGENVVYVVL